MKALRMGFAAGLLALSLSAARAQDVVGFGSTTPGTNLTSPINVVADNNPFRVVTFSGTTADPAGPFQFNDNNPGGANTSPVYGTNLSQGVVALVLGTTGDTLTLSFAQAITSLSFDFAAGDANDVATLTGGGQQATGAGTLVPSVIPNPDPNGVPAFFDAYQGSLGIQSATPFTTASISLTGDLFYFAFDNFRIGPAAVVPEPGVLGLAIAGSVTGIGLLRRKRRN